MRGKDQKQSLENATVVNRRKNQLKRKRWLAVLGCVVVLMTALALMVPAISITKDVAEQTEGIDLQATPGASELQGAESPATEEADNSGDDQGAPEDEADAPASDEPAPSEPSDGSDDQGSTSSDAADSGESSSAASSDDKDDSAASTDKDDSKDSADKDEADYPAQDFKGEVLDGEGNVVMTVIVKAPKGAFPAGTEMKIEALDADSVADKVETAIQDDPSIDGTVKSMTAIDIRFIDKKGKEIEPAKNVEVRITSGTVAEIESPVLVHVVDKSKDSAKGKTADAEVVKKVDVVDEEATDDTLKFKTKEFSPYVIVEMENLTTQVITASGETYNVTVSYAPEANIPEGAELVVTEIVEGDEAYAEYLDQVNGELGSEVGFARFFDITIMADGEAVQPNVPVSVSIEVADATELSDGVQAVHFADEGGVEVLDANLQGETVNFTAESFSIYAIIGTDNNKRLVYNFYSNDTPVSTQYVKPIDSKPEEDENYPGWLYDPGIVSEYGQVFLGWQINGTGEIMDISALNEDLATRFESDYNDGDEVNVYAAFTKAWYIRYMTQDNDGVTTVLRSESVAQDAPMSQRIFTINYEIDISDQQLFKGWIALNGWAFQQGDKVLLGEPDEGVEVITGDDGRPYFMQGEDRVYVNADGHLDLYLKLQNRYWLVFVDNDTVINDAGEEVSGGATYTPPQRIFNDGAGGEEDAVTIQPDDPTWRGYEFVGWNTSADGRGDWWLKYRTETVTDPESGVSYERVTDTLEVASQFGTTLSNDVTLYAIWTPVITEYNVIFWQQVATDSVGLDSNQKHYSYARSVTRYALTGQEVSITNADRNMGGTTTSTFGYYFTYNSDNSDTAKHAAADGTTVLNVYYDRRTITVAFTSNNGSFPATTTTYTGVVDGETVTLYPDGEGGYYYVRETSEDVTVYPTPRYEVSSNDYDDNPVKYGWYNNSMVRLYYGADWFGNRGWFRTYQYGLYYNRYDDTRYIESNNGTVGVFNNRIVPLAADGSYTYTVPGTENVPYDGEVETSSTSQQVSSYTLTGLYKAPLTDWPIAGSGYAWSVSNTSNSYYLGKLTSFEIPASVNTSGNQTTWNLYRRSISSNQTLYYIQMDTEGNYPSREYDSSPIQTGSTQITMNRNKYEGFDFDKYIWGTNSGTISEGAGSMTATRGGNAAADMYAYYARHQAKIHYVSTNDGTETYDSDLIYYQAGLSDYGPGGEKYDQYVPTNAKEGYVFEGWYLDEGCTIPFDFNTEKMTDTGITLYAKWVYERVRVVLVPTPNNYDNDSVSFPNNQALTFRLNYNEAISDANINPSVAKRLGYKLISWYTDPFYDDQTEWNFREQVNKDVVDGNGNPVVNMDYHNSPYWSQYGDNDGSHDDVVGIMFLYAKWELDVDENAIYVEYEVDDDYLVYDSLGNLKTTVPVDTLKYLIPTDEYDSRVVHIAEAPTNYAPGYNFSQWVVLNADGTESAENYNPGDTWELSGNNYQQFVTTKTLTDSNGDPITDDEGKPVTMQVIRIKAKFLIQTEKSTEVTYDPNGGSGDQITQAYFINEDFDMLGDGAFAREGYTLVGWAFDSEADWHKFVDGDGEALTGNPDVLNDDGTALIGFTLGAHVAADNLNSSDTYHTVANTDDNLVYAVWRPNPYNLTIKQVVLDENGDVDDNATVTFNYRFGAIDYTANPTSFDLQGTTDDESSRAYEGIYAGSLLNLIVPNGNADYERVSITLNDESVDAISNTPMPGQDSVIVVTYKPRRTELTIKKQDENSEGLPGARFQILKGQTLITTLTLGEEVLADGTIPMDNVSEITVGNLPAGTYTLVETAAPAGYVLLGDGIEFTVTINNDGSASVSLPEPREDAFADGGTITVKNTPGHALPTTGGPGTTALTVIGVAMIVVAAIMLITRRRPAAARSGAQGRPSLKRGGR